MCFCVAFFFDFYCLMHLFHWRSLPFAGFSSISFSQKIDIDKMQTKTYLLAPTNNCNYYQCVTIYQKTTDIIILVNQQVMLQLLVALNKASENQLEGFQ